MDIELIKQFGQWLLKVRKARGLTQQQLEDATGVNKRTILMLEKGKATSLTPVVKTSLESFFNPSKCIVAPASVDAVAEVVAADDFEERVSSVMSGLRLSRKEAIITIIKNDLNM